jgi:hypothetical protein
VVATCRHEAAGLLKFERSGRAWLRKHQARP